MTKLSDMRRHRIGLGAILFGATMLLGCSGGTGSTGTIESTIVETTIADSTTIESIPPFIFKFSPDPQETLNALAKLENAVDQSRISESRCGKFSLIVERTRIRFFQWSNESWVERSNLLGPDGSDEPFMVTTRDYTGDSIPEFLISYRKAAPYGAIFAQNACTWGWSNFINLADEYSQVVNELQWSDETLTLTGVENSAGSETSNIVFTYDQSQRAFVSEIDPYSNPDLVWIAEACETERITFVVVIKNRFIDSYSYSPSALDGYWEWRDAYVDAERALNSVGTYVLNLTAREQSGLQDLGWGSLGYGVYSGIFRTAHDRLQAYCSLVPPR
jgi:hypothetical protein